MRATIPAAADSPGLPGNIRRDRRTVDVMMRLFCRNRHGRPHGSLCPECRALADYAGERLAKCPFGPSKTTCRVCPVHCYRPAEREAMRQVMRETGPRMLCRHPWLALRHLWVERQGPPPWPTPGAGRPA